MSPISNVSNPNKHLIIPKWINEEYFNDILQQDIPNFSRIIDFKTIAATAPGENFASTMVRIVMEIELKNKEQQVTSCILKTTLPSGESAALFSRMNLFQREKQMYQLHLKKFETLYKEAGHNVKFGPKSLRIEETPERITLVLEDFQRQNYKNVDRLKGMDLAHARCVLRKLAELHAVSAVYYELNGAFDEMYMTTFFTESNRPIFEAMAESQKEIFGRAMREWGLENVETYIKELSDPKRVFEEGLKMNTVDPNEFNVLNHGDCWANNIMFNYKENGEIDDAIFIDFQMGKRGTPAQDLWYFIITSTSMDIKTQEFDYFIFIYHKHLKECLQMLKYPKPIPTLKEMHILMLNYGYWGVLTTTSTLTVVLYPSDKETNMEIFSSPIPRPMNSNRKSFRILCMGVLVAKFTRFLKTEASLTGSWMLNESIMHLSSAQSYIWDKEFLANYKRVLFQR